MNRHTRYGTSEENWFMRSHGMPLRQVYATSGWGRGRGAGGHHDFSDETHPYGEPEAPTDATAAPGEVDTLRGHQWGRSTPGHEMRQGGCRASIRVHSH